MQKQKAASKGGLVAGNGNANRYNAWRDRMNRLTSLLRCMTIVLLMTGTVFAAPFRHETSGVVIDPPAGWRLEMDAGAVPTYYLRRKVTEEDVEEALRSATEAPADDAEANELASGQTCQVGFPSIPQGSEQYAQALRDPAYLDRQKAEWGTQYDAVSATRVVRGSTVEVTLIGNAKATPDRRTAEILLINPRAMVSIRCAASQLRFKMLQPEFERIVHGITLPE
jgi:hypothetical protein